MNTRDHEPLTLEERSLAQRLSRLDANAAPSLELDARILAAAREAAKPATPATSTHRPRPRWPLGMGIAASLGLAIGVAWQLRPLPEDVRIEHPAASAYGISLPESASDAIDTTGDDAQAMPASAAMPIEPAPEPAPTIAAPAPAVEQAERAVRRQAAAPAVVFDEPSPIDLPAPPPPPPPPPAPPAPPAPRASAAAAAVPVPAAEESASDNAPAAAQYRISARELEKQQDAQRERNDAFSLDSIVVTGSRLVITDDQPDEDQPPASADSPEVRETWLARVRELLADGQREAALDSLREFHRRHPGYRLPDDLRDLLDP